MDAWEAYRDARSALARFDNGNGTVREQYILLGKALQQGWDHVRVVDPLDPLSVKGGGEIDAQTIRTAGPILELLRRRNVLVNQLRDAFDALPPDLQATVRAADRP